MKAGEILGHRRGLAEAGDERLGGLERVVLGGDAADELDELHARHRVHEMHADEALGIRGDGSEPGDRDRRGVGGEDRVRPHERAQVGENLALDVLVLGRRLDHEIAVGEFVERRRADAFEHRLPAGVIELPLGDLARQEAVDRRERRVAPAPRRRR